MKKKKGAETEWIIEREKRYEKEGDRERKKVETGRRAMKAARLHDYGHPLVLEDVRRPRRGRGRSWSGWVGRILPQRHPRDRRRDPVLPRMPLTLGHENAGIVHGSREGVTSVREGDAVAVFGGWGCGRCDYCVTGYEQLCESPAVGRLSMHDGGYAEYLLVPHERYLVKLAKLTPTEAAPLTDAALTPYRAITQGACRSCEPDHYALVIGLGGSGPVRTEAAEAAERLPRHRRGRLGATSCDSRANWAPRIRSTAGIRTSRRRSAMLTRGHGVTAAFDFVGSDATLALAVGATRVARQGQPDRAGRRRRANEGAREHAASKCSSRRRCGARSRNCARSSPSPKAASSRRYRSNARRSSASTTSTLDSSAETFRGPAPSSRPRA